MKPQKICRTCLKVLTDTCQVFNLFSSGSNTEPSTILWDKIRDCVPEVNLNITPTAVVCMDCATTVDLAYNFKLKCLQTEELIHRFVTNDGSSSIDLVKIVQYYEEPHTEKSQLAEVKNETHSEVINVLVSCHSVAETSNLDIHDDICTVKPDINSKPRQGLESTAQNQNLTVKLENKIQKEHDRVIKTEVVLNQSVCNTKTDPLLLEANQETLAIPKTESNQMHDILMVNSQPNTKLSGIHTAEKPFKCKMCPYSSLQKISLQKHMQVHRKINYKCQHCHYKTNSKSLFVKHVCIRSNKDTEKITYKCKGSHKCASCNYKTTQKADLENHMKIHATAAVYKCDICSYVTLFKFTLTRHIRTHTKPFACMVCDYRTSANYWLQNHVKKHL